jgi:hypothetical protein
MRTAIVGALIAGALIAAPAAAANVTVDCGGLQSALNSASAGEVITLDQLCTSGFPYQMPGVAVTLTGTPGAGFQGGTGFQLYGGEAPATIEHLTFEDAQNTGASSYPALAFNAAPIGYNLILADDAFVNDAAGGAYAFTAGAAAVTVTDSTFTDDAARQDGGGGLVLDGGVANLTGDSFTGDSAPAANTSGGGLEAHIEPGSMISSSQFSNDTSTGGGGGAAITIDSNAAGGLFTMSGDTFSHNYVADPGGISKVPHEGGGLAFAAQGGPVTLEQSDNTFDSNSVSFKAAPLLAAGGGESVSDAALQSVADRFTNNTLQPPDAPQNAHMEHVWGWGAGLSVTECGDSAPAPAGTQNVVSSLSDAVIAGNMLISGPSANGAGVYVGAPPPPCAAAYTTLELFDSTVAGNSISGAGGPIAGISGGPHDVLSLQNTIVDGDDGGAELGGFGTNFANVSASYSDVCSGSEPFAGAGNLCAEPKLVNPGAGSADVRETAASPTLEAGSNALIPSGLGSDAFGNPRISGPLGCTSSPAPSVDIGAAQFVYPTPSCPPSTPPPRPPARRLVQEQATRAVIAADRIGNQLLQLIAPTACTASKALLSLQARSIPQPGRHSLSYKVTQVAFYIDGGLKTRVLVGRHHHRHHKTVDEPQDQSKRLPSTFTFLPSKIGAHPGANTVVVKITLVAYTGKGKHRKTHQITRTLKSTFDVC